MRKKIVCLLSVCFFVISCKNEKLRKSISEKFPDGKTKTEEYYKYRIESKDTVNTEKIKEIKYWENGSKQMEGNYKNNKRNGWWISYFPNGKKQSEGGFKNDLGEGKRIVYNENGKILYTGYYKKGNPDGKWEIYDSNGKKIIERIYKDNKVVNEKKF
ncbi:MAG: hypothetical protein WC223_09590 [Bacteroidales bacterium]|jgi:antitoxin component YwqK of YwqJK toxin-antitoxin module